MPIISFTPADALQTTMAEAGNYNAVISQIEGPKQSQSQKSLNFFVTFRVTDGPLAGKEFTICLNSGMNNASILGGMQFMPANAFLQIEAAILNKKVEPVARPDFDTDTLINKPLTLGIAVSTDEGKLLNVINSFLPYGSTQGAVPF